jgi:hypothetical protein
MHKNSASRWTPNENTQVNVPRAIPSPDNLYPFARTTIETKGASEEEIAEVVQCILLSSSIDEDIVAFEYDPKACRWCCESLSGSCERLKFSVQMFKLKRGAIVVEWKRLMGSSPMFSDLYKECKAALTSENKINRVSSNELRRSRSDSATNLLKVIDCYALDSRLPMLNEDEYSSSCKSLEAWLEKDPHEAKAAFLSLSLSVPITRGSPKWLSSPQIIYA